MMEHDDDFDDIPVESIPVMDLVSSEIEDDEDSDIFDFIENQFDKSLSSSSSNPSSSAAAADHHHHSASETNNSGGRLQNIAEEEEGDHPMINNNNSLINQREEDVGRNLGETLSLEEDVFTTLSREEGITTPLSKEQQDEESKSRHLFENLDGKWQSLRAEEETLHRVCFAAFSEVFHQSFPFEDVVKKGQENAVYVPVAVAHLLWNHMLPKDEEPVKSVTEVLVDKLHLLRYRTLTLPRQKLSCLQLADDVTREYGHHVFSTSFRNGHLQSYGETEQRILVSLHETMAKLLAERIHDNVEATSTTSSSESKAIDLYAVMAYPHHVLYSSSSPSKTELILSDDSFLSRRIATLGTLKGIRAHIRDCEMIIDETKADKTAAAASHKISQIYEMMSFQCQTSLSSSSTTSNEQIQIAQSLQSIANSLQHADFDRSAMTECVKYYEKALSILDNLLNKTKNNDDDDYDDNDHYDKIFNNNTILPAQLKEIQLSMAQICYDLGSYHSEEYTLQGSTSHLNSTHFQLPRDDTAIDPSAMEYYQRSLRLRSYVLYKRHILVSEAQHAIGTLLFYSKRYDESIRYFKESFSTHTLLTEEEDYSHKRKRNLELEIASKLEWMGHANFAVGKCEVAYSNLNEALKIRMMYCHKEHEDVATLYHCMGLVYVALGKYEMSLKRYHHALKIRKGFLSRSKGEDEKTKEKWMEGVVQTLVCMGNVYKELEEVDEALECFREAMELKQTLCYSHVSGLDEWEEQNDDARTLPPPMYRNTTHSMEYEDLDEDVTTLSNDDMGWEEVWQNSSLADKEEVVLLLTIMALVADLSILKYGRDHLMVAEVLLSMAKIYVKTAEHNKAIVCLEEVIRTRERNNAMGDVEECALMKYKLAMCYARTGTVGKAIELYTELHHELTSDDEDENGATKSPLLTDILYNVGNAQSTLGWNDDAVSSLEKAYQMRKNLYSNDDTTPQRTIEIANARHCLSVIYIYLDKRREALNLLEENLTLYKTHLGEMHVHVGHTLYYLGQTHQLSARDEENPSLEQTRLDEALECYEQSLFLYQSHFSPNHIVLGHVLHSIGTLHNAREKYSRALSYFRDALEVYRAYNDGEHLGVAILHHCMGVISSRKGDDRRALEYWKDALRIRRAIMGQEHLSVADTLQHMGGVYTKRGSYDDAMDCYDQALEIRERYCGEDHALVAKTALKIGVVYAHRNQYGMALEKFKRALRSLKHQSTSSSLDRDEDIASVYYNTGNVHARTGDYELAVECCQTALQIRRTLLGDDHITIGNMLHNLGIMHREKRDFKSAQSCFEEALRIKASKLGKDSSSYASTLCRDAELQAAWRNYEGALVRYEEALSVQKLHCGDDSVKVAEILHRIGVVLVENGSYNIALARLQEALRIREEVLPDDHEDLASTLHLIGRVYDKKGKYDDALIYYGDAFKIYKKCRGVTDADRQRVVNELRNVVTNTHSTTGFWDALVATGNNCWTSKSMDIK